MSESMVERVAKAIRDCEASHDGSLPWIEHCARAAIEAMREPTQAMLDAGDEYDMQFVDEGGYPWEYYRVMIDAALKEGQ